MRLLRSLKSTHWVTWSSPVLLVVLVLTLTATSKPTSPAASASRTTTSLTPTRAPKKTVEPTTTLPVANVTPPTTRPTSTSTLVAIPTTTSRNVANSSSKTGSSVKPVAVASGETVGSGALSGQLTPSFNVADVPLDGPGTWSLVTSAPADATLQCANALASVQSQVIVAAKESCQFIIKTIIPSSSLTWQLTPVS
ncbi:MAG TPA: hypothetical protein VII65_04160 [Acidimicrobiales bacterium]